VSHFVSRHIRSNPSQPQIKALIRVAAQSGSHTNFCQCADAAVGAGASADFAAAAAAVPLTNPHRYHNMNGGGPGRAVAGRVGGAGAGALSWGGGRGGGGGPPPFSTFHLGLIMSECASHENRTEPNRTETLSMVMCLSGPFPSSFPPAGMWVQCFLDGPTPRQAANQPTNQQPCTSCHC